MLEIARHTCRVWTRDCAYTGDIFTLAGSDSLRWHILRAEIPFLLGTWGAHTIRACAPYIAEVKVGGTANPALLRHIVAVVRGAVVSWPCLPSSGRIIPPIGSKPTHALYTPTPPAA